jgi:hypothetical protein
MKKRLLVIPLLVLTSLVMGACANGASPASNMQNREALASIDVEASAGNESVSMEDLIEITGVISMISDGTWTIAGQNFLLTPQTETEGVLKVGDLVKVHALIGMDGEVYAREITPVEAAVSSVDLPEGLQDNGQNIELVGVVDSMGETTWTISKHDIVVNSQTEVNGDFSAGTLVRVQASADESQGLVAQKIETAQGLVSDASDKTGADELKVAGYVESITDEFVIIDGTTFFFSDLTEIKDEISVGDYVEVYFFEQDGQKVALEIELEDLNDDDQGELEDDDDLEDEDDDDLDDHDDDDLDDDDDRETEDDDHHDESKHETGDDD